MMNFLNNMNLIPKNFIITNIVDTLKDDPEEGAEKVFEMADKFVKDTDTLAIIDQVKDAYYTRPAVRMYVKNLIYNTKKSCLINFLQNIVMKELIEGLSKREQLSKKYQTIIPHGFILDMEENQLNEIDRLVNQGRELGIHLVILANDNNGLNTIFEKYSDVQFLLLTKSNFLTEKRCMTLTEMGNVFPMVINDNNSDTSHLKSSGLMYGMMTTTNSINYQEVTSEAAILQQIRQGSRINWFVTSKIDRIETQRIQQLKQRIDEIRQTRPYITLHLETDQLNGMGDLYVEEKVNEKTYRVKFPMIKWENSKGRSLIQILSKN